MKKEKWFTAKGIFLHKSQVTHQKQWFEERIILLKAKNVKEALKLAKKEAKSYVKQLDKAIFIEITDIYTLYEEKLGNKCEIFSSKTISILEPEKYIETFYSTTQKNCEEIGEKHCWHNLDNKNSACYNCLVTRKGRLWEIENE